MSAWWQALSSRERRALVLAGLVVALALSYAVVWHPLSRAVTTAQAQVQALRAEQAWVHQAAAELRARRGRAGHVPVGDLSAAVRAAARAEQLDAVVTPPSPTAGDVLSASVKPSDAAHVLHWIARMQAAGIVIRDLSLVPTSPGMLGAELQVTGAPGR